MNILRWTGHALIDVGIAGLCAFRRRERPEDLTLEDLDAAADFMVQSYYSGSLNTFLTCVFMNASFVQPNEGADKRDAFIRQYLRAHRAAPDPRVAGQRCAFSGLPATSPLARTHLPLFSGEGVMNFRPDGQTVVPAAGPFVVALFFLPMASRRAEGRLLAVHADDPNLTLFFAQRYLDDNRRLLALALPVERAAVHEGYDRELPMWDAAKKRYKAADVKGPRSLVVSDLGAIGQKSGPTYDGRHAVALSVYLLSNSGQGPSLEIFHLPSAAVSFVVAASGARTHAAWKTIAERFYPLQAAGEEGGGKPRRAGKATAIEGRAGWTRNPAFEDLCDIFDAGFTDRAAAAWWLRRYLLCRLGPKDAYAAGGDIHYEKHRAPCWALAELFLKEVIGMKQARIKAIGDFADKIAPHVKDSRNLKRALFYAPHPWEVRQALVREQKELAKNGKLLFGLDEFAQVWLHEDGDERLVRDLVCIRVVEKLHEAGVTLEESSDNPDVSAEG